MQNKKLVTILSCLLVIIIGVVATILIIKNSEGDNDAYRKKLQTANKYLEEENWDDAIVAYLEAIDENDKDEDAYLALAQIYIYQNQMDEAKAILEQGIEVTNSQKLKDYYNRYFGGESSKSEEKKEESSIQLNTSLLKEIAKYSFEDYSGKYGFSDIDMERDGCVVTYKDFDGAAFTYYNTEEKTNLVDIGNKTPRDIAMPWEVSLNTVSILISGIEDKLSYTELENLDVNNVKFNETTSIIEFDSNNCEVTVTCDSEGNISSDSTVMIIPKDGNEEVAETSEVQGTLVSATTGEGIANAVIYVRDRGQYTGTPLFETETDNNGDYELNIEEGEYTAEIECEGYITENIDFDIDKWGDISTEQFIISEELEDGQIRIVLEWGEYPRDLDSHLNGDNGHACYVCMGEGAVNLDVDDTTSYGPETVTIDDISGEYEYFVHDYTESGNISSSNAIVKVYMPGIMAQLSRQKSKTFIMN